MGKKRRLWLALFMAISLAFLLGASPVSWATQPQKPIILKYHDPSKAGTSRTKAVEETLLEIEKRTGGRIKHETYWAESLIKAKDALKGVQAGTAEVGLVHGSMYYPTRFPAWQFTQLLFVGGNDVYPVIQACNELYERNPILRNEFDATGLQFLTTTALTPTTIISRTPLKEIKDFHGLKMRAIGPVAKWVASLGGSPRPVSFYEVNEALSRGVIDAVQSYIYLSHAYKFFETCKYQPLNGVNHVEAEYWINKDALSKMSPEAQKIYLETWRTFYIDRLVKYYDEETQMQLSDFQKAGVHLYYLTSEQLAKWKESAKPINQAYYEEMSKKGFDGGKIVADYQALYDKHERKK